jgi:hypothetical protein
MSFLHGRGLQTFAPRRRFWLALIVEPAKHSNAGIVTKCPDSTEKWMPGTFAGTVHAVIEFTVTFAA